MIASPDSCAASNSSLNVLEHAVEQIKEANFYLRTSLDQMAEGVMIVETTATDAKTGPAILYANSQAVMMTRAKPETGLRGMGLLEIAASEEDAARITSCLEAAVASTGAAECQAALQWLGGSGSTPCLWRVRAVFTDMGRLLKFIVTLKPVSAAEATVKAPSTEDLDAQSVQLRKENLAALAQGITHDVNNLIGPAVTRLSALLPQVEEGTPLHQELQLIFAALKRAKQFTSQVVNVSKARPRPEEPTDVAALLRDSVQFAGAGSNVQVRLQADPALCPALADPVKLSQVVQNLVFNGIQAMPCGGYMDVEARNVEVPASGQARLKAGPHVQIIVRDRGCGIEPENLKKLFRESFSTKADGNGIGLTTCKRFIDEMGGDIQVSSTPNVGTEFRVLLRAGQTAQGTVTGTPASVAPVPLKHGCGKVLIVDDEDDLRRVAQMILKRCGYECIECDNGQDAIKIYQSLYRTGTPPDVVLMDLTLRGGMNGCETAAEILSLDRDARIVCTSGSVTTDVQMTFLERGFVGVLPKPYEAGELTQTVHRVATAMRRGA
ncbi:MAG: response regulator [Verrucomicrobiaceae bacterium]|jgi:signal transduction histidine kinase/ActR/RegA family two-component response regulator|nr:response regulator [Verrucomicrobiaceae bacterium]